MAFSIYLLDGIIVSDRQVWKLYDPTSHLVNYLFHLITQTGSHLCKTCTFDDYLGVNAFIGTSNMVFESGVLKVFLQLLMV